VAAIVSAKEARVPTYTFGAAGAQIPIVAFGASTRFLSYEDEQPALAVLSRAIDLGINYIDTAQSYDDGNTERRVGLLMPTRRQEVFLATKIGARKADDARRQLDLSLKRLKTDRLDIIHIENVESLEDLAAIEAPDGVLKTVLAARDHKVTRFAGITSRADPLTTMAVLERDDFDCVQMAAHVVQVRMRSDDQRPNRVPMAESYDAPTMPLATATKQMGVIAMKMFGHDRLLGQTPADELLYCALSPPAWMALARFSRHHRDRVIPPRAAMRSL
jgi:aryl-alcohol dehydrogenase-like predicted oxidoreductase